MVIYTNTATQTLLPGQTLALTKVSGCNCGSNCSINPTSGAKVNGNGIFVVSFAGNVASGTAATAVELTLAVNGNLIPTSRMISTPSTANVFNSVSTVTGVSGSGCCLGTTITVINTGSAPITVAANSSVVIWQDK